MSLNYDLPPQRAVEADWPALRDRFAWLAAMENCPQDPVHHGEGDVAIHVRLVLEALLADGWERWSATEQRLLFWAVLLHDVAKPATTRMDEGRWRAPGHSRKGQLMARGILWRLGAPVAERETICHLVTHHQIPFFLLEREDWRRRLALISWQTRCDLLEALARADAKGRIAPDREALLSRIALFGEAAREEGCRCQPREFANDHARFRFFRDADRYIDAPTHDDRICEIWVTSGMPGSGKSCWVAANAADRPVISLDGIREDLEIGPREPQGPVIAEARERARRQLRACQDFVWDATCITRRTRSAIISLADDYRARIRIIAFETGPDELFRRNRERPMQAQLPEAAIDRMVGKWEMPDLTECHALEVVQNASVLLETR